MNIEFRKFLRKSKFIHSILVYIAYNSGIFYYKKIYKERKYNTVYADLKNSKANKRCFIIGNGPSLDPKDLDKLAGEDCFGANELYKIFPETKFRPKYYVLTDRYTKVTPEVIKSIECEKFFLSDYYCRFNKVLRDDFICFHTYMYLSRNKFSISEDISKKIIGAATVSFASMQIAAYMGYSEVYLLGFDHNYTYEFSSDGKTIKTDSKSSHFFKDDEPKDIIANVRGMTAAYEAFRDYAKTHGISVYNATRGGKLEVFERVDFDSLF